MTDRVELREAELEATRLTLAARWVGENLYPLVLPVTLVGAAATLMGLFVPPLLIVGALVVCGGALILLATIVLLVVLANRIADTDRRRGIRWNGSTYEDTTSDRE